MVVYSSLLFLYDSVLISFLSDWINDEDLCCLDTAVCSRFFRPHFLFLMCSCYTINTTTHRNDSDKEWMLSRGVRLKSLVLDRDVSSFRTVLKSQLSSVKVKDLSLLQRSFAHMAIHECRVSLGHQVSDELISIGKCIAHIDFEINGTEDFYGRIATYCPLLKSIRCYSLNNTGDAILPLVDTCRLNCIEKCNLKYLVDRIPCLQTYCCDLVKVLKRDETTVCLGESKYYQVTAIHQRRLALLNEVAMVVPLLPTVQTLSCRVQSSLIEHAASQCRRLTSLELLDVHVVKDDLLVLIQHSVHMTELSVTNEKLLTDGDKLILSVASHCLKLQRCVFKGVCIQSDTLVQLFGNCHDMNFFQCDTLWDLSVVVDHFASEIEVFEVQFGPLISVEKSGRGGKKLSILGSVSVSKLMEIVDKNRSLREIILQGVTYLSDDLLGQIVESCPHLTKLAAHNGSKSYVELTLSGLTKCKKLSSLFLSNIILSDESCLECLKKVGIVRHLTLCECRTVRGDLIMLTAASSSSQELAPAKCNQVNHDYIVSDLVGCVQALLC